MVIRFSIIYKTAFGDKLQLKILPGSNNAQPLLIDMTYEAAEEWVAEEDFKKLKLKEFSYQYQLLQAGGTIDVLPTVFNIQTKHYKTNLLQVKDEWVATNAIDHLLTTRPFIKLLPVQNRAVKHISKSSTHCILLHTNETDEKLTPCLSGEGKKLTNWSDEEPLLFTKIETGWELSMNLAKEQHELSFKIGLFDGDQKKIIAWEPGPNRVLQPAVKDSLQVQHIIQYFPEQAWRGAGINVQLSSLKTNRGWGVGDFTDLFLLSDLTKKAGMKLIQLLPVNDTTGTHTAADSYPYSAISAFALHPVYLNVQKMATAFSVTLPATMLEEVKTLQAGTVLDYEKVSELKAQAVKLIYENEKQFFKDDLDWFEFFELNRDWLQPYAAFCYLRDKYNTPDFTQWKEYSKYDESQVQELVSREGKAYEQIALHYFIQYHLHLQLKDATDYAHRSGIVLKADLPIGVGRHSVDTWMHTDLFHMGMQAGAPPDAFAVKGQNWSFPTYNWEAMAENNFGWWRQRMEQLSNYFDAVRIDHVLGFFRIWSIPMTAVEGILGRFYPAVSLSADDIKNAGINFYEERYCEPFITPEILEQFFGEGAGSIQSTFLNGQAFKKEFDTQRKIADFITDHPDYNWAFQGLLDMQANRIFLYDEQDGHYHFRINIFETKSFQYLPAEERQQLDKLYVHYFFHLQNALWEKEGIKKLEALRLSANNMLLCGEDLGMVPEFVPGILHHMQILSLQVERMPKQNTESFSLPKNSPYDAVVTPSTHDMSTIREWWEEDRELTQKFYNGPLGHSGYAPFYCEDWICKQIIAQHLYSPAMWAVFLMQDLLATDASLRKEDPRTERINIPADPKHVWNYRMHLSLEEILEADSFTDSIKQLVRESGR